MRIFNNLVVATTGKLPSENRDIKRWVDAHGGTWSASMSKGVTHLIASAEAWKKCDKSVEKAITIGALVVSYDWLEDSLQRKRRLSEKKYTWEAISAQKKMRKALVRSGQGWDGKVFTEGCIVLKELTGSGKWLPKPKERKSFFFPAEEVASKNTKQEATSTRTVKSPERRSQTAEPAVPIAPTEPTLENEEQQTKTPHIKDSYHTYVDATGYEHRLTLVCTDPPTNTHARYRLFLMESHSKPHTYATLVEYAPQPQKQLPSQSWGIYQKISSERTTMSLSGMQASSNEAEDETSRFASLITKALPALDRPHTALICPMQSEFHTAWRAWRQVFRDLTLLSWEERLGAGTSEFQKARAKYWNSKHYVFRLPEGRSHGTIPQDPALLAHDEEYVWNFFNLPGIPQRSHRNETSAPVVKDGYGYERVKKEESTI